MNMDRFSEHRDTFLDEDVEARLDREMERGDQKMQTQRDDKAVEEAERKEPPCPS